MTNTDEKSKAERIIAEARAARQRSYREQALKLFPHVCGRCGREFEGRKLRELTVHHKDHNHDNNPPDGSNWELLCLYCHEQEHAKFVGDAPSGSVEHEAGHSSYKPFAGLGDLLKDD
jgi:hypothetical protein